MDDAEKGLTYAVWLYLRIRIAGSGSEIHAQQSISALAHESNQTPGQLLFAFPVGFGLHSQVC